MQSDGNFDVSWQGGDYNYVGGLGWHYGDKNRVIGYSFDQDSGANFITVYGWGYNKNMSVSNPAHLVEYSTYRTLREQKPSIISKPTFINTGEDLISRYPLDKNGRLSLLTTLKLGLIQAGYLPDMNNFDASDDSTYQVIAVEVFNPPKNGTVSGRV